MQGLSEIGVGLGGGAATRKGGKPPPRGRASLAPALRRAVAELHAKRVFVDHIEAHLGRASYEQIAEALTVVAVPAVRCRGPWTGQMVFDLVRRVRRNAKSGDRH